MHQTRKRVNFPAIIAICASAFAIGIGLCGLDYLLASRGIGKSTEEFGVGPLDGVSVAVMFFSALGLVLTLIAWAATAIFRSASSTGADSTLEKDQEHEEPHDR